MMSNDPVVQRQMDAMRAAQAEAAGYSSQAIASTRPRGTPGEMMAQGFLSQFDPSKLKGEGGENPAGGLKVAAGEGMQLAAAGPGMGLRAGGGSPGLTAPAFASGIGASLGAMAPAEQAQTPIASYGLAGPAPQDQRKTAAELRDTGSIFSKFRAMF